MSAVTKNERMRDMVDTCTKNKLKFSWVLFEKWFVFVFVGNMKHIKLNHCKDFISTLKTTLWLH
jgi:hypothetical protein